MKLSPRYLKRYKDIAVLFARYSQPGMGSRFSAEAGSNGMGADRDETAATLPNDLERLGPTFVKIGQLLSSRADLLPPKYLKALARLQDNVKPFPFEDVEFIVETELGTRMNKAFSHFDPTPLAAASLGQVHAAALHDCRPVVVKVQRPNIAKQIEEDFAALREAAKFLHKHTKLGQRYQFVRIVDEFENTIARELDYRREAANMMMLRRHLADFKRIVIPNAIEDYTTHKIPLINLSIGRC